VLGENFVGVLVSDCLAVYDLESGLQQKCYAIISSIQAAKALDAASGEGFLSELSDLLKKAMALGGLTEAPSHRRSKRPHARQQADPSERFHPNWDRRRI
jgi:hypothetical protein